MKVEVVTLKIIRVALLVILPQEGEWLLVKKKGNAML